MLQTLNFLFRFCVANFLFRFCVAEGHLNIIFLPPGLQYRLRFCAAFLECAMACDGHTTVLACSDQTTSPSHSTPPTPCCTLLQRVEGPTHYCYGATTPGVPVWNPATFHFT